MGKIPFKRDDPVGTVQRDSDGRPWIKRWPALMPDLAARASKVHDDLVAEGLHGTAVLDSKEEWMEGFLYDMHPDQEIEKWEIMLKNFKAKAADRGKLARKRIWKEGFNSVFVVHRKTPSN